MTQPISRHDPRVRAWVAFLRGHDRVIRRLERELHAEQGLALTDYDVLVQLAGADERQLRMSELAERLLLSRSGATRLVDRLAAGGLVERRTCADDRRGQWAALTAAGYERLRAATPTHLRGVAEHFVDRLGPDELVALERMMERLLEDDASSVSGPPRRAASGSSGRAGPRAPARGTGRTPPEPLPDRSRPSGR
jgi:DNA-binding MarR family transcriptional regulator